MTAAQANRPGIGGVNVAFDYDPLVFTPVEGQRVKVAASRKVVPLDAIGDPLELGEIISVRNSLNEVVVRCDFLRNCQDRIAGEIVAIGRGVFGPSDKVYQYTPAAPARHDGTTTGVKTVVVDTDDTIKAKIQGGSSQTIVITAGVGLTLAAIAAEINETLTDMHVEIDAAGNANLVADDIFRTIEIEAVTHDAYTQLGWTAAVYLPTTPSHDPCVATMLIVVGGAEGAAVETLER